MANQEDLAERLEQHRHFYEPAHHWRARKEFITRNYNDYPEGQLVSMSMVWANMMFDGCKYAPELMEKVETLAAGIEIGESGPSQAPVLEKRTWQTTETKKRKPESTTGWQSKVPKVQSTGKPDSANQTQPVNAKATFTIDSDMTLCNASVLEQVSIKMRELPTNSNPLGLFHNTFAKFKLQPQYTYVDKSEVIPSLDGKKKNQTKHQWQAILHVSDVFITSATSSCKSEARRLCGLNAIDVLKSDNLIVREVARNIDGRKVMRKEVIAIGKQKKDPAYNANPHKPESVNPISRFVILDTGHNAIAGNPVGTLVSSCQMCKLEFSFDFKDVFENVTDKTKALSKSVCKVSIEGQVVGVGVDPIKKNSKRLAAEKALNRLRKTYPIVKVNEEIKEAMSKQEIMGTKNKSEEELPESNIGNRLLKKMGWSGGGLGKEGNEGIEKPVSVEQNFRTTGLGFTQPVINGALDRTTAETIVQNYVASSTTEEMVFSSELSQNDRKLLHQAASKFKLKSLSRGVGKNRFLVISRKVDVTELVANLTENGGKSKVYSLIQPGE